MTPEGKQCVPDGQLYFRKKSVTNTQEMRSLGSGAEALGVKMRRNALLLGKEPVMSLATS